MKVLIVGGGVGGLTAALCMQRFGWQVDVLEQAHALDSTGAGIQISPNGSKVLAKLGVLEALKTFYFLPEQIEMRHGLSGREIFSIPLRAEALTRWGAPYLHLHRADLVNELASTLERRSTGALHLDHRFLRYEQHADHIVAYVENGSTFKADLLIGADGIHSGVAQQMLGDTPARFTGNVAWRMTVPMNMLGENTPPPSACVWVGPGRHAVTYQLRGGTLANFVGVVEQDTWHPESWTERGSRAQALADFAHWHPIITTLIDRAEIHYRWALFDRPPLKQWSDERAVLLGDACHSMLPFLAQGAVMAIEDAWVLASSLANIANNHTADTLREGLLSYFEQRIARTSKVQSRARGNRFIFHHRSFAAQFFQYAPMWLAAKTWPTFIHSRQDWLYGFDVTQ